MHKSSTSCESTSQPGSITFWRDVFFESRQISPHEAAIAHLEKMGVDHPLPTQDTFPLSPIIGVNVPQVEQYSFVAFRTFYRSSDPFTRYALWYFLRKMYSARHGFTQKYESSDRGIRYKSWLSKHKQFNPAICFLVSNDFSTVDHILLNPACEAADPLFLSIKRSDRATVLPILDRISSIYISTLPLSETDQFFPKERISITINDFCSRIAQSVVERVRLVIEHDTDDDKKTLFLSELRELIQEKLCNILSASFKAELNGGGPPSSYSNFFRIRGTSDHPIDVLLAQNHCERQCPPISRSNLNMQDNEVRQLCERYDAEVFVHGGNRVPANHYPVGIKLHFQGEKDAKKILSQITKLGRFKEFSIGGFSLDGHTSLTGPACVNSLELIDMIQYIVENTDIFETKFQYQFTFPARVNSDLVVPLILAILFTNRPEHNPEFAHRALDTTHLDETGVHSLIYDAGVRYNHLPHVKGSTGRTDIIGLYDHAAAIHGSTVHTLMTYLQHAPDSDVGKLGFSFFREFWSILEKYNLPPDFSFPESIPPSQRVNRDLTHLFSYYFVKPDLLLEAAHLKPRQKQKMTAEIPLLNSIIRMSREYYTQFNLWQRENPGVCPEQGQFINYDISQLLAKYVVLLAEIKIVRRLPIVEYFPQVKPV